ncbi:MAG TPA: family 43 glycosylhydrolase [Candidatus Eisenbergiella merdavium]|uniref:Family 43 glycosylhydrolase n=1 Tax=Candidatus Eisenbergiella merdavium TaxID=2838551 RepID=A0A9D2NGN5_9FIRM|nr:family 43 glycosylhydrolase [Candidatus Eisenbergiella merdavium]
MRNIISLNENWKFEKPGEAEKIVSLPHTWNNVDGQDGGNDYYRGMCTYTRELELPKPEDGKRVWLEITGAAMSAAVYLNGEEITRHEGGYSAFRADLTDHLTGKDTLRITVDNSENTRVYPQKADFTFYGGLYREVRLVIVPAAHFALGYWGSEGIRVTPHVAEGSESAEVEITVYAEDAEGCAVAVRVAGSAEGTKGMEGAEKTAVIKDGCADVVISIPHVHLWNGLEDPYLYTASAVLESGDRVETRFGCRSFEIDPQKGFLLNGKPYPLRGVSRHQDREGLGNALTGKEHEEDMAIIREMGANTIRLAHYQHAQEFYDLCDETGMIVWAEIPYITQHMPQGRENTLSQMKELVIQNYNHPSIVCWGLSNEITASPVEDKEDLLENHRLLNELCHSLDKTRPTAMANVFMLEPEDEILAIPDINSYNLYYGWYLGELGQNEEFFDRYHAAYPDRAIGFSEYGADANPRFQSAAPEKGDYTESYQCVYHEHILKMLTERPYIWASHVWNMFDFAADGRDEGGRRGVNQKGLVSFDRKLKKDAFYLYKAYWSREPFVHICGRRYENRVGERAEIRVYSNQPTVTLTVDGAEAETKTGDKIFRFEIPLTGSHEITAQAGEGCGSCSARTADGVCTDKIVIRRVSEADPAYSLGRKGDVANWFDKEDLKEGYYSIKDTLGELTAHPGTGAIINRMMEKVAASRGDVAKAANQNAALQKMMAGMSLESLLKQAGDALLPEQIKALNAALQKFEKPKKEKAYRKLELSMESRLSQIFAHEESRGLFDRYLPGMRSKVEGQSSILGFSLGQLVAFSKGAVPKKTAEELDKALQALEIYAEQEEGYTEEQPLTPEAAKIVRGEKRNAVYPGRVWRDTEGKRIQAHAGAVLYEDGVYYWYGENKDRTDGKSPVWTWGIRAYRSTDLYNWEDMGLIIRPDLENQKAGLYPEKHVDRPHIVKCDATGKYVCWIKQSGDEACFLILEADAFAGPYRVVKEAYRPFGMKVGDFDMVKEEGGKCFLFMDADHAGVVGMELSADYLEAVGVISKQYENLHPPFCREGITLFERGGRKYMLTSGMTGYIPNKSDSAVSDAWTEPFVSQGNPHVDDGTNASFNSQISQVFRVPGKKELYVAIADRWVPGYHVDAKRADTIERVIASRYEPDKYPVAPKERSIVVESPMLESADTSAADYVWLPLEFDGEKVRIRWQDEWRMEDYE